MVDLLDLIRAISVISGSFPTSNHGNQVLAYSVFPGLAVLRPWAIDGWPSRPAEGGSYKKPCLRYDKAKAYWAVAHPIKCPILRSRDFVISQNC